MLLIMMVRKRQSYIIGIDEVGRGPLAGPVVVCAVAIPRTFRVTSLKQRTPLRDSKKLSALQRNAWASAIKTDPRIRHAIASTSPRTIDRVNVTQAANRAATRALTKLLTALPDASRVVVFLDGGLHIREMRKMKKETLEKFVSIHAYTNKGTAIKFKATTVIKGDETIPAISFASIVAKEHRDAFMRRAHKTHPLYGFDRHVGYGTKKHIAAIKANGRTPLHRNSFLKKIL